MEERTMKKINIILTALSAAFVLSFAGCTTGNSDLDVALKPAYIIGGVTADDTSGTDMWSTKRAALTFDTSGVATYSFTYSDNNATAWGDGAGYSSFKLLLDDAGATAWATSSSSLDADTDLVTEVGGANNIKLCDLTTGSTYKITITAKGATVTVSYTKTASGALSSADVSALNSTTAVQSGAYVKIEGASYSSVAGIKAYFDGNTTATSFFQITSTESNSWGMDHLGAWFKFYAGDGTSLKEANAQFYSTSTTLGTAVTISATQDNGTYGNFECTDMTGAVGVYKLTITTTTSGATMKLEKIN
jgi:hypothetical protein